MPSPSKSNATAASTVLPTAGQALLATPEDTVANEVRRLLAVTGASCRPCAHELGKAALGGIVASEDSEANAIVAELTDTAGTSSPGAKVPWRARLVPASTAALATTGVTGAELLLRNGLSLGRLAETLVASQAPRTVLTAGEDSIVASWSCRVALQIAAARLLCCTRARDRR